VSVIGNGGIEGGTVDLPDYLHIRLGDGEVVLNQLRECVVQDALQVMDDTVVPKMVNREGLAEVLRMAGQCREVGQVHR
jgi:hypothetical protein